MEKDIWNNPLDRVIDIKDMLNQTYLDDSPKTKQISLEDFNPSSQNKLKNKYTQDWPAYDAAKTNEDIMFKKLLSELLFLGIENDNKTKIGRKAYSLQDRIFTMCIKVFYKSDLRKAQSILKELKNLHYIEKVPCYKSIDNFFNNSEITKVLDELILLSSLPLANLETTGAIDGTGFATKRCEKWRNYKYGNKEKGKEKIWRKAHAMVGCKTNVFISVKMTESKVNDIVMFEDVLGNKTKYFNMENFVADKGYSSRKVVDFIYKLGLQPYIPFKKHVTGKAKGSQLWSKLFFEFKNQNEEYMKKYHVRSNVETCFHMVKQRFGDYLMTKNYIANENELKIKFLCHNLCVLIQELFEKDINIDFSSCVKKANLCNN